MAGEASADLHGSNLVKAVNRLDSDVVFWGIGGKNMEEAGVKVLFSSSDMAAVGVTESLRRLPTILKALGRLKLILKSRRPDLLILIDYPDFNIHIARTAKHYGIPVLYYISPQVWAWRSGRVKKIASRVDRMAVILPFEEEFYRKRGVKVDFVGHPLLDSCPTEIDRRQVAVELGVDRNYPVLGLLPGSRKHEIRNLLPTMVKSAEIIGQRYPEIHCFLPLAPTIEPEFVKCLVADSLVRINIIQGDIHKVLSACHVAMVTSGTATLETGIMGTPMVVVYRATAVSYWMAKMMVKVPFISLVNLVAGEEVVQELIQDEVVPERLASEALTLLEDKDVRHNMIEKFKKIKKGLGSVGASDTTAKIALEMMKKVI